MSTVVPGMSWGLRASLMSAAMAEGPAEDAGALLAAYLAPVPEPDLVDIDPARPWPGWSSSTCSLGARRARR